MAEYVYSTATADAEHRRPTPHLLPDDRTAMTTTPRTSPGDTLRGLLDRDGVLAAPGGGTPLEAHCAAAAGFEAFYLSGYAVAAWRHGQPDLGVTGMTDVVDAVAAITTSTPVSVIVDADTGYGDVTAVAATVRRLEQAGAAAVQIEDQVAPKRCGHMQGKEVIPVLQMERKVAAAVRTRADALVIARTDALGPLGVDEAIERGKRYHDLGVDAVFVDAPESREHLERIATEIPGRLIVNLTESGRTPILPLEEIDAMGYAIALYPTAALRLAGRVISELYAGIRDAGSTAAWQPQMMSLDEMNALMGQGRVDDLEAAVLTQLPERG
ncbi:MULTISPECIES: oxaloacetate decarboxylase [unclassified Aeromicrobium]|uniref:isocitrate lyase/PEP mutase family protein n=2 Tax=Aeromicrobium TaxID=2040 RepID=UPI0012E0D949|nr:MULTISPECIES: isocitrate lyase/phosphoenolpyruvate mutase family protein [unclassified Aeromicrobium]